MGSVFRALPNLVAEGSVFYIEGTSICPEVQNFLNSRQVPEIAQVSRNTLWPEPRTFHVPATYKNLDELAALATNHNEFEVCDHIQIYFQNKIIVSGCDFMSDPIRVSKSFPEKEIANFSNEVGCRYKESAL